MSHSPKNNHTTLMSTCLGEFNLQRIPADQKLQAWESADQHLLNYIDENRLLKPNTRILILNDQFGALCVALANYKTCLLSDSYLSQQALSLNLTHNQLPAGQVSFCNSLNMPQSEFDLILIKIPKTLALLEHQLHQLTAVINSKTIVIAAGMTRHIHNSTLQLFERITGSTSTTLAWKKSRLILIDEYHASKQGQSPYPDSFVLAIERDLTIYNHANLFSRDKLDAGTRLMLEHMPSSERYQQIVDLGCGNGILGLVAALFNSDAELSFADESYMAVESARLSFSAAFAKQRSAVFRVGNCLQAFDTGGSDLVLSNPPFHQHNSVGDAIAWQMFIDARRVLRPEGELRVVGNRHLGYHAKLKKLFGNCEQIASNGKYVILKAIRQ